MSHIEPTNQSPDILLGNFTLILLHLQVVYIESNIVNKFVDQIDYAKRKNTHPVTHFTHGAYNKN
jgi:hypothetical protein